MPLKLNTASSGSVTLIPADTASNYTITVPAQTATVITNKTAGTVLQVVNATYGTQVSSSNNTFVDTGLTASITPTSATSKILVLVSQNGCRKSSASADNMIDLRLMRDSTQLSAFYGALGSTDTAIANTVSASVCYLDSPATTSSVTYKTQFASRNNTASVQVQFAGVSVSTITLLEIAA